MSDQPTVDVLANFKAQIEQEDSELKTAADNLTAQLSAAQVALQALQAQQTFIAKQQALITEFRAEVARIEASVAPVPVSADTPVTDPNGSAG